MTVDHEWALRHTLIWGRCRGYVGYIYPHASPGRVTAAIGVQLTTDDSCEWHFSLLLCWFLPVSNSRCVRNHSRWYWPLIRNGSGNDQESYTPDLHDGGIDTYKVVPINYADSRFRGLSCDHKRGSSKPDSVHVWFSWFIIMLYTHIARHHDHSNTRTIG